jgi:hypothetical protein
VTPLEAIQRLELSLVPENGCPDMRTTPDGYMHCGKCEACLNGEALSIVIDLARESQGHAIPHGHGIHVPVYPTHKVSESETFVRSLRTISTVAGVFRPTS